MNVNDKLGNRINFIFWIGVVCDSEHYLFRFLLLVLHLSPYNNIDVAPPYEGESRVLTGIQVSAAELLPLSVRVETALEVLWESAHWFTGVAGWSLWHTVSVNYA